MKRGLLVLFAFLALLKPATAHDSDAAWAAFQEISQAIFRAAHHHHDEPPEPYVEGPPPPPESPQEDAYGQQRGFYARAMPTRVLSYLDSIGQHQALITGRRDGDCPGGAFGGWGVVLRAKTPISGVVCAAGPEGPFAFIEDRRP